MQQGTDKDRRPTRRSPVELLLALGGRTRLKALAGLFAMALIGAAFEVLGVGLVFPLITMISDPDLISQSAWLSRIHGFVGAPAPNTFIMILALLMIAVFVIKAAQVTLYYHLELRFLARWKAEVSDAMMARYLHATYAETSLTNSAGPIRTMGKLVPKLFDGFVRAFLTLAVNGVTVVSLLVVAIIVEPIVLAVAAGMLLLLYMQRRIFGRRLVRLGERFAEITRLRHRYLQETFGSLKEAKVLQREDFLADGFGAINARFIDNRRRTLFIGSLPPHVTEVTLSCGVLLLIVGVLASNQPPAQMLASLGVLAAAAFRMAPLASRLLIALNALSYGRHAAELVVDGLAKPLPAPPVSQPDVRRFEQIRFDNLTYRHTNAQHAALRDIDLTLHHGECLGLTGPSGAGKSTLGDLLLGLIEPTSGRILVDGEPFSGTALTARTGVGYVPQQVYLLDDTVRRNVAFGTSDHEIDDERVWSVLEQARIIDEIGALPRQLDTIVGEHGATFSAGQRQRLGLARALYHDSEFIVLDEVTSALDAATELAVVEAIAALKGRKTFLVIAHRRSALTLCDRLVILSDGEIQWEGPAIGARLELAEAVTWQQERMA